MIHGAPDYSAGKEAHSNATGVIYADGMAHSRTSLPSDYWPCPCKHEVKKCIGLWNLQFGTASMNFKLFTEQSNAWGGKVHILR